MSMNSHSMHQLAVLGASARALRDEPAPGSQFINHRSLGLVLPIGGGARGYNAQADTLQRSSDGRDLNDIWAEFQATVRIQNAERQRIVDLLTFSVTQNIEDVPQFGSEKFERATEYGVPRAIRPSGDILSLGYDFDWWDLRVGFTWQFLADATAQRIEANNTMALEADNRLVFTEVMRTLFRKDNRDADINGKNYTVFSFWNGDGTVPPPYKGNTFDGSYSHYRTTGANTLDSADLDEAIDAFVAHGYSSENGTTLFSMMNRTESKVVRTFRVATGAAYDFIPAQGQPGLFLPGNGQELFGNQVAANFRGLNVVGSYGPLLIIEEDYVPPAYVVTLASGGPDNIQNPIGIREHAQASLRGLQLIPGDRTKYPLVNSYYIRGFGTGVRQRGAGLIQKVTSSATYTPPPAYV